MNFAKLLKIFGLFIGLSFIFLLGGRPGQAAVQGNPQVVGLSVNQSSFVPGAIFTLNIDIQQGTQNNLIDGWVWVVLPDGSRAFLQPDFATWSSAPAPTVRNFTAVDFSGPVFQSIVPAFLPLGTYTFFAAGTAPGFDPSEAIHRLTNLASTPVALAEFPALDLTGTWQGTWQSVSGVGGGLTVEIVHTGTSLGGTVSVMGSSCSTTALLSGNVQDNTVVFGSDFEGARRSDFRGTVSAEGTAASGSYIERSGPCAGDSGTWSIIKAS